MKKLVAIGLFVLAIIMLPLAVTTALRWAGILVDISHIPDMFASFLGLFIIIPVMVVILLRCFYLPYILPAVLIPMYAFFLFRDGHTGRLSRREVIQFVVIATIIILGLFSVEQLFMSAMSV